MLQAVCKWLLEQLFEQLLKRLLAARDGGRIESTGPYFYESVFVGPRRLREGVNEPPTP